MKFELRRDDARSDVTFGTLRCDEFVCETLENPWLDNEPYVSCIPRGTYQCKRVDSPRFGITFEVGGVDDRSHILFHWGNYEKDTLGCILLGEARRPDAQPPMITNSRKTFGRFIKFTQVTDEFELEIS